MKQFRGEGDFLPTGRSASIAGLDLEREPADTVTGRVKNLPSGPGSRLVQFGRLAGGIASGMAAEGLRSLASGRLPSTADLLLTRQNANRVAERLSELRGAAMKVGQLLSMEAGDLIPVELSAVLARLRDDAHRMPLGQVASVLNQAWGKEWPQRFRYFNFQPLAAASIGQVHEASSKDGRRLAIKIQSPGVRASIDSDVNNVARLLSLVGALPNIADLTYLFTEAKGQLHAEADYLREAAYLEIYRSHLGDHPRFVLPDVVHEWTTPEVLVMSYLPGDSLEMIDQEDWTVGNGVATDMLELSFRELFDWGLVQTDPNFANYRYDRDGGRIGLLDFGAVRRYPPERTELLRRLLGAAVRRDKKRLMQTAGEAGYLDAADASICQEAICGLLLDVTEPARHDGAYDFGSSKLADRMKERLLAMRVEAHCWRLPSPDLLFLHRKLSGIYMLCTRLRAKVPVRKILDPWLVE